MCVVSGIAVYLAVLYVSWHLSRSLHNRAAGLRHDGKLRNGVGCTVFLFMCAVGRSHVFDVVVYMPQQLPV